RRRVNSTVMALPQVPMNESNPSNSSVPQVEPNVRPVLDSAAQQTLEFTNRNYSAYWNARNDLVKTIISLASGSVVLTVTFSGSLLTEKGNPWNRLLFASWALFLLSLISGVLCLWHSARLNSTLLRLLTLPEEINRFTMQSI